MPRRIGPTAPAPQSAQSPEPARPSASQRREASRARRAASQSGAQPQATHGQSPYPTGGRLRQATPPRDTLAPSPYAASTQPSVQQSPTPSPGANAQSHTRRQSVDLAAHPTLSNMEADLAAEFESIFGPPPDVASTPTAEEAMAYMGLLSGLNQHVHQLWLTPQGTANEGIQNAFSEIARQLQIIRDHTLQTAMDALPSVQQVLEMGDGFTAQQTHAVHSALADVETWYKALSEAHAVVLPQSEAKHMFCAISLQPFDRLAHPVLVRAGRVPHVFEAEDLLHWLSETLNNPDHPGTGVHPLTRGPLPLEDLAAVRASAEQESA